MRLECELKAALVTAAVGAVFAKGQRGGTRTARLGNLCRGRLTCQILRSFPTGMPFSESF